MKSEHLWDRLLEFLNSWGTASETAPGRIQVTLPTADGCTKSVAILMTSEEWDNMVSVPWGNFGAAAQEVRRAILGLRYHQRFLVYADYGLVPSATPDLPVEQLPQGLGRWAVTDQHGNVVDGSDSDSDSD